MKAEEIIQHIQQLLLGLEQEDLKSVIQYLKKISSADVDDPKIAIIPQKNQLSRC